MAYILAIGTSMIDIYGTSDKVKVKGCNPGPIRISFGGVSRNIVENLLKINVHTKFVSVFGEDVLGLKMKEELESLGCDLKDSLFVCEPSATFMGIINEKKELMHGIADSRIMKHLTMDYLKTKEEIIKNSAYVVFDVNDYNLYEDFIKDYQDVKIIIDPVSPFKAKKIKHLLPYFHTIKPNLKEAEVLCGFELNDQASIKKAGNYFLTIGVKQVFITMGELGVYYKNQAEEGFIRAENVEVRNDIGAGDSFVAGLCFGYLKGYSLKETATFAYLIAIHNLMRDDTVAKDLTLENVLSLNKTSFIFES